MPAAVVPETVACIRTTRAIIGSATLRAPYTLIIAANPVRFRRPIGSLRNEECSQTPARTAGSDSSSITAAVPPTNSAMGFFNTRHDSELAGSNASSRNGHAKLLWRPGAPLKSASTAPLRYRCNGSGRRMAESMDQSIRLRAAVARPRLAFRRPAADRPHLFPLNSAISNPESSKCPTQESDSNSVADAAHVGERRRECPDDGGPGRALASCQSRSDPPQRGRGRRQRSKEDGEVLDSSVRAKPHVVDDLDL